VSKSRRRTIHLLLAITFAIGYSQLAPATGVAARGDEL